MIDRCRASKGCPHSDDSVGWAVRACSRRIVTGTKVKAPSGWSRCPRCRRLCATAKLLFQRPGTYRNADEKGFPAAWAELCSNFEKDWLGRQDSNLGMAVPKTAALPLGDAPTVPGCLAKRSAGCKGEVCDFPGL
jgi:hypothetical protein